MYKNIPAEFRKFKLDNELFLIHKTGSGKSDFGMDNTPHLLENGFGLYSTIDLKNKIGPIKTEYYRISLTRTGTADFDVGLEKYKPRRNSILFGFPGQIFSLHEFSPDFLAYYMLFSESLIAEAIPDLNKKQRFPFFSFSGTQCFELKEETAVDIEFIIFKMEQEIRRNQSGCSDMIRLYIQQILILANRNYGEWIINNTGRTGALQDLFNNYLKLVSQHFLTMRKVSEYARMLHVSADHLNRAIKSCSDKTAHEFIDEMILIEAKNYLLYTKLTIAEIAYKLDFSDPSHFNRSFKKIALCTPLEFRNRS